MALDIQIKLQLDGFNLAIKEQLNLDGIIGVLGHSGSGKTSLLRVLSGLELKATGTVKLALKTLFDSDAKVNVKTEDRGIGFVFQDARLFNHLNVTDNLMFAVKRSKTANLNLAEVAKLTHIEHLLSRSVIDLSAGEKQRVALARAILAEPQLLLLDEPLSALDSKARSEMVSVLKDIHLRLKLPMIYVSHSVVEIQQLADHVLVMGAGKVIQSGHVHQVINQLHNSVANELSRQTSLTLTVKQHLVSFGLTQLSFINSTNHAVDEPQTKSAIKLFSNIVNQPLNSEVRCYVLATDIAVSTELNQNNSMLNSLSGKIIEIQRNNDNTQRVSIDVDEQKFTAIISRYSVEKLKLATGKTVHFSFKASALRFN